MTTDENQDRKPISKGLRERMQDCQMELVDDSAPQHLHRVGASDWELPGTDFTLTYCPVNRWFVAFATPKSITLGTGFPSCNVTSTFDGFTSLWMIPFW